MQKLSDRDVMQSTTRNRVSQVLRVAGNSNLSTLLKTTSKTAVSDSAGHSGHVSMQKATTTDDSTSDHCFNSKTSGPQDVGFISHVPYVGRLAPTPSGYMHGKSCRNNRWGSLMATGTTIRAIYSMFATALLESFDLSSRRSI